MGSKAVRERRAQAKAKKVKKGTAVTTDNEASIEPINHVGTASETAIESDDQVAVSSKVKVSEDCGALYLI